MKLMQKLVLVPIEKWEELKTKNIPVREVSVNQVQTAASLSPVTHQKGLGKIHQVQNFPKKEKLTQKLLKRQRVKYLFNKFRKGKKLRFNKQNEVFYKGKKLDNVKVSELISHALNKKVEINPKGMKIFYKVLSEMSLPKSLIQNDDGQKLIQNYLKWRPPGKIDH